MIYQEKAHFLRSRYNCIKHIQKSVNKDNSLLNCRINGLNDLSPSRIIIDKNLKLKKNLNIFNNTKKRKTYIIYIFYKTQKFHFLSQRI